MNDSHPSHEPSELLMLGYRRRHRAVTSAARISSIIPNSHGFSGVRRRHSGCAAAFVVAFLTLGLANSVSFASPIIFALDTLNNELIRVDLGGGTATSAPLTSGGSPFVAGSVLQSMAFAPDGTLYAGFRQASPYTLTTIDPATAEVTGIVSDFPSTGAAENIAFAPDGVLCASETGIISEVELGLSPVSSISTGVDFGSDLDSMEISGTGTFFYTDTYFSGGDRTTLYMRDGLNGVSTALATYEDEIFGLTFAEEGKLYAASENFDLLYEVDTTTGALTQVFDFSTMGTDVRIGALASFVVPEPPSAVLLASVGFIALLRRR